ncbi:MAG: DNA mismatch endonuclease Vsr [Verrucomicrobia bacterium]|nr:DNA mismatch endonuclease Vsr [Verrucomicrobiota bacterium]
MRGEHGQLRKKTRQAKRPSRKSARTSPSTSKSIRQKVAVADTLTAVERSERMSRIRSHGNRATELRLIALMREHRITGWRRGAPLLGKPDFVFRAAKLAVFVDGCFWHGCPRHARIPKTRVAFWKAKLARNAQRDREVKSTLRRRGWRVLRIWEHELAQRNEAQLLRRIRAALSGLG